MSTRACGQSGRPGRAARRRESRAFTLVELLVVIMIFIMLVGLLVPTISKLRTRAMVRKTEVIISTLHGACKAYFTDLQVYPSSDPIDHAGYTGSQWLTQALTGYMDGGMPWRLSGDGKEGFGFRTAPRGKVYGPYNGTERLDVHSASEGEVVRRWFIDAFKQPILYYRYEGEDGYMDAHNNDGPDYLNSVYLRGPDLIDDGTDDYHRTDFVLLSRGPNEKWDAPYHDVDGDGTREWDRNSDDITNFLEQ